LVLIKKQYTVLKISFLLNQENTVLGNKIHKI
jgi:hypothetical protein